jgi:hypothetical protein
MAALQGSETMNAGSKCETVDAKDTTHEITVSAERFSRRTNGRWTAELRVELIVQLPDGRELRENRLVSLGGIIQEGRRPTRRS